jgi:archaetidylinositol phosphate synthase
MLSRLKQRFQSLLSSQARIAYRIGISPNLVSILGFCFSILSALAYFFSYAQSWILIIAVCLVLLSGFCDVFDGVLARTNNQVSVFWGFFYSVLDRYSDSIIFLGVILGGLCDPVWGIFALIGSFLVSYSRGRAESLGIKMISIGLMERAERLILLLISTLIAVFWLPALNVGIAILAVLTNFTVLQRVLYVNKSLKKK